VIDTHCHLGLCEPDDAELVAAARGAGVTRMLTVGIDEQTSRDAIAAAEEHDEVWAAVGRHPNGTTGFDDDAAAEIERLAAHERVAAVGETGLDYYRDRAPRPDQHRAFRAHIEIARRARKPLVIHVRDGGQTTDGEALAETFDTLRAEATGVTVVLHCFSAPAARALEAADWGWYCSFAGNATYPSAGELREAARAVPDELLLVETDAPFLSPQPVRGRPNQPAHVVETARLVAEERGASYAELEELVEANAARIFNWAGTPGRGAEDVAGG
jgi:TatD DNase family protein